MSLAMRKHLQISARKTSKSDMKGGKDTVRFRAQGVAPAPSRDFFELLIFERSVLWRTWRVKNSREVTFLPSEQRIPLEDFPDHKSICSLIRINLGEESLEIAYGFSFRDWLQRLPKPIFNKLVMYLQAKELCALCRVSKALNLKCKNEAIWKQKFQKDFPVAEDQDPEASPKSVNDPAKYGWKRSYKLEFRRRLISGI